MSNIVITHHKLELHIDKNGRKHPVYPLTNISIEDIFDHFNKLGYQNKDRRFKNNRFCGLMPIVKLQKSKNRIDLLLCLSDKDADNQIVRDFDNIQKVRPLLRKKTEGVDSVVHIVIKTDSKYKLNASFAMERKTGLTPYFFVSTLNYFLKDMIDSNPNHFQGNHPTDTDKDGNPKKLRLKLKFKYTNALSDEIVEAFENGRVKDIIFHKPINDPKQIDPVGNLLAKKNTMYLDVAGKLIKSSSKNLKEKYQDLKDYLNRVAKNNSGLQGVEFTIKFKNVSGSEQTAYYDSEHSEFSLSKKSYAPESLKQPASEELSLNMDLCDKIFKDIG